MLTNYERRKFRTRARIAKGNRSGRLRASVHRTNINLYVQLSDAKGSIVCSFSTLSLKQTGIPGMDKARLVGKEFAKTCLERGIKEIVFDKGAYAYNGRVKAVAEACREAGLKF